MPYMTTIEQMPHKNILPELIKGINDHIWAKLLYLFQL